MNYSRMYWNYGGTTSASNNIFDNSQIPEFMQSDYPMNNWYNQSDLIGSDVVDASEAVEQSMGEFDEAEDVTDSTVSIANTIGEELPEAEAVASDTPLAPFVAAWGIGKAVGEGINDMEIQSQNQNLIQQTLNNKMVPGMANFLNVSNIEQWNQSQIANTRAIGSFGSNFGILGQVIGHLAGESMESQIPQSELNTAWSAAGKIDPTSDNVNITNDALSIPSSAISEGEQQSEDSNALDVTPQ